ncbi:pentapeptide repeat-containing protein [Amycolatopsis sp. NPDC004378]
MQGANLNSALIDRTRFKETNLSGANLTGISRASLAARLALTSHWWALHVVAELLYTSGRQHVMSRPFVLIIGAWTWCPVARHLRAADTKCCPPLPFSWLPTGSCGHQARHDLRPQLLP